MAKGEFVVQVTLSPADWAHLDAMAAAGGWCDVPTLAANLLRAVIEDDRVAEQPAIDRAA